MAAPKGNEFWKLADGIGRKRLWESPEELWEDCVGYFEWVRDHPLKEEKLFCSQGTVIREEVSRMRAMTISGLCVYLNIDVDTWGRYRRREEFRGICSRVDAIIYEQKFSGAAADLFNASIIARDLGLRDKVDATSDGRHVADPPQELSEDELKQELERRGLPTSILDN